MREKIFEVISTIMEVPLSDISEDSSPETLEYWDSLRHMKLILALEEALSVQFSDEQIVEMISVRLILSTLEKHGVAQ